MGEVSLQSGVTLQFVPGAAQLRDDNRVVARAAAPEPTLSISTLSSAAETFSIEITNVPAHAELRVTSIVERDTTVSPACPEQTAGQIQCLDSDDPRCTAPETTTLSDDPNSVVFEWSQPGCIRTNFTISPPPTAEPEAMRIGVVGRTSSPRNTREALDTLTEEDPRLVFMLGDNAEGSSLSELNRLASLLDSYDFPTYLLPGEAETTPSSRANFRAVFGPYDHNFRHGGVRFVVLYSAGGIVGSTRIFQLRNTLLRFADKDPIVVLTHTPPVDPLGARNDGLLSEIEGARTLSILSDFGADLLLTGHINDAHDLDVRGLDMYVTSAAKHGRQVLLLTAPVDIEDADALKVESISLD